MNVRLFATLLIALTFTACSKDEEPEPVITPPAPVISPAEMTSTPQNEVEYTFKAITQGSKYTWDFGDGQTGKGKTVTHTFPKAGNYTVVLKVLDTEEVEHFGEKVIDIDVDNAYILSHGWEIVSGTKEGKEYADANGSAYTFYGNGEGLAGSSIDMPWEFNGDESQVILWPGLEYEVAWNLDELSMWEMAINFTSSKGEAYTYKFEQR